MRLPWGIAVSTSISFIRLINVSLLAITNIYKLYWVDRQLSIGYNGFMISKFRYWIVPENIYQITVDDYDGNPYTFEISGEKISAILRREALLDRILEEG